MFISSIEISNFKSVGSIPKKIDFAPITMLFGANGIGKSTVLHALGYLFEIFIHKNLDPSHLTTCDNVNVAGFKGLIHEHDLSKEMRFKIDLVGAAQFSLPYNDFFRGQALQNRLLDMGIYGGPFVGSNSDPIGHLQIDFTLKFDAIQKRVVICQFVLAINGEKITNIKVPKQGLPYLSDFNFNHKLFSIADDSFYFDDFHVQARLEEIRSFDSAKSLSQRLIEFGINEENIKLDCFDALDLFDFGQSPWLFEFACKLDEDEDISDKAKQASDVAMFLQIIVLEPIRKIKQSLKKLIHIGPIRTIPGLYFEPSSLISKQGWYSGKSAWDNLFQCEETLERVNLNLKNVMGLDHSIIIKKFDDVSHLRLIDTAKVEIPLTSMGVGISQVMPIIVACLSKTKSNLSESKLFVMVEQPELHIHPKLQLSLADLIIKSALLKASPFDRKSIDEFRLSRPPEELESKELVMKPFFQHTFREARDHSRYKYLIHHCQIPDDILDKVFSFAQCDRQLLLETHSEHLVLRFLRRIRESDEGKVIFERRIQPSHVKINCMYKKDGHVEIDVMRITRDGDLSSKWPGGFFDERDEELF
ncbi:DUF3696 domain-containing protein [Aliiglaciecola sp. SL4]|uniref:DUF3696 domain-containing protein n=1 Tax=Aliiglaciecola sp. SL4 TaxID=3239806 RepID=UPI00355BB5D6